MTMSILAEESQTGWFAPLSKLSGEYSFEDTYVAQASVKRSRLHVENYDEHDTILRLVLTPRTKFGVLRLGLEWERFSFGGLPGFAPLPNTLQQLAAVIGLDVQFSDSILARFEATPGFYGANHLDADQINVPFIAGGTYIYNPSIQFILGVSIDVEREYPVIPVAGIRWKFSRPWVLNAVLPEPRLEYEARKGLTIYAGATIKQTNFRMDDDFGRAAGIHRLDHSVLTYSELRGGVGMDWRLASFATLSAEAGYQPYRSFDFYRADVRFRQDGSAPYGMISVHGAF